MSVIIFLISLSTLIFVGTKERTKVRTYKIIYVRHYGHFKFRDYIDYIKQNETVYLGIAMLVAVILITVAPACTSTINLIKEYISQMYL